MLPTLIRTVDLFFTALYIILFARILMSWFPHSQGQLRVVIFRITEPVLMPIRKIIQRSPLGGPGMVIDITPIFAFPLIFILRDFTISMLQRL